MKTQMMLLRNSAIGAILATTSLAFAGPIGMVRVDGMLAFSLTAMHGPLNASAGHGLAGGVNWVTGGTITESAGFVWDNMAISGTAQHIIPPPGPPHGEGPNPAAFLYGMGASALGKATGAYAEPAVIGALTHGAHSDSFVATLTYTVIRGWTGWDITGYTHVVAGKHSDYGQYDGRHLCLTSDQCIPPVFSNASGAGAILIDPVRSRMEMTIAVQGIPQNEITSAQLCMGGPNANGPVILDLGPGNTWQSANGEGCVRVVQDAAINPTMMQQLVNNQAYVVVRSAHYPTGELRGQVQIELIAMSLQSIRQDYIGDPTARDVTVLLSKNGAVVEGQTGRLQPDGTFTYKTARRGSYDVSMKSTNWLRSKQPVFLHRGVAHLSFSLRNGDCDDSNEIDIGDFAILSSAYNSMQGDTNWNERADLDGDGEVSIQDYAIMSRNFGAYGDPE